SSPRCGDSVLPVVSFYCDLDLLFVRADGGGTSECVSGGDLSALWARHFPHTGDVVVLGEYPSHGRSHGLVVEHPVDGRRRGRRGGSLRVRGRCRTTSRFRGSRIRSLRRLRTRPVRVRPARSHEECGSAQPREQHTSCPHVGNTSTRPDSTLAKKLPHHVHAVAEPCTQKCVPHHACRSPVNTRSACSSASGPV